MKLRYTSICALLILLLSSCASTNESSKYQFVDGFYKARIFDNKKTQVYATINEDSINVFKIDDRSKQFNIDTLQSLAISFSAVQSDTLFNPYNFTQRSFDLDILTIPIKYRPATASLSNQLNTNLNGALYIGYRRDIYKLTYKRTPLGVSKRKITHYGYSYGLFTGLGATAMNPTVTNDQITSEYDGVVFIKGIAGIVGINNFTFGLALGIDHLMDKNHKVWIYQGKPWIGLTVGLNIN